MKSAVPVGAADQSSPGHAILKRLRGFPGPLLGPLLSISIRFIKHLV